MGSRLAIGPANYAGQAYAWAQAVNTHTDAEASAFAVGRLRGGSFAFPSHRRIPAPYYYLPGAFGARARWFLRGATHVILDGYRTIFYDRSPDAFARQAAFLAKGFTFGLFGHGTDVRDPEAHMERYAHSYYRDSGEDYLNRCTATSRRNRRTARALGVPLFVSTPDMLYDLPEATWVPVCLNPADWRTDRPLLPEGRRPRVLFVPSQRTPPIKGTRHVDPVLRRLADAGVIDYLAPVGVPHAQMRDLVKDVDVVVDQLQFGSYGVAAVEAMAAGRVVVGNISTLTADQMPELPRVVSATPLDFEERLLEAISRPDDMRADADYNLGFVSRWHDGRESATRLAGFLGATLTG